jgi:predicted nuclease of predicted toxin-antitoxin system
MKLLLDANISWRLCSFLDKNFGECTHVNKTELPCPAKDIEIWNYAIKNGYTIVTQDSDFLNFLETKGSPPKVILIKTGNLSIEQMQVILLQAKSSIMELHNSEEYGLLEIL